MVDTPAVRVGSLCHLSWGDQTGNGGDHQPCDSGIHLHQTQVKHPPPPTHTHIFDMTA